MFDQDVIATADLERVIGGGSAANRPAGPDGYVPIANPIRNPRQALDNIDTNLEHLNRDVGRITGEVLGTDTGAEYLSRIAGTAYDWLSPVSWANYFANGR